MRRSVAALGAALLIACGGGCKKPSSTPGQEAKPVAPKPPRVETVAQIHWLGKKPLLSDTNSAALKEIWEMPETARLRTQTLDKLALAPWLMARGGAETNNAGSEKLRVLLDDCLQEETYLEIRNATNLPGETVVAMRLPANRAGLWETNLAAALEELTSIHPEGQTNGGWSLKKHDSPNLIELRRVGEWTLVGLANNSNGLLPEIAARINTDGAPVADSATNLWLNARFDLPRIASALGLHWQLPPEWPAMSIRMELKNGIVRSSGKLKFPAALPFQLEPWNVPTNLINDPLVSFTALQGMEPWVSKLGLWQKLGAGTFPKQLFFWAQDGVPFLTFAAAPDAKAKEKIAKISDYLAKDGSAWLAANGVGRFTTRTNGVEWADIMIMNPFLESLTSNGGDFMFGGLIPRVSTNRPAPTELIQQVAGRTNLVAYDWEITGPRIEQWLYFGQLTRMLVAKAQVPPESPSVSWLRALETRLGNCVTVVTREGADELAFVRNSGLGLSAMELHLLVDWLESPLFPKGLNTFEGTPQQLPAKLKSPSTNTVPAK